MVAQLPQDAAPPAEDGAIVLSLSDQGFECTVRIDDLPLQLYQIQRVGTVNSGYIESQGGQTFTVNAVDTRPAGPNWTSWVCKLFVDGKLTENFIVDSPSRRDVPFAGARTGPTTMAPYLFSELKTTDDETSACNEEAFVKEVGTLVVRIWRVTAGQSGATPQTSYYSGIVSKTIDERAKKGSISHQTSAGANVSIGPATTRSCVDIDSQSGPPFVEFRFNYRSKMILEMNDIIPMAQPVAGTSDNAKVKQEKREGKRAAITIDLSDDDMPLVKREKSSNAKAASGVKKEQVVIVIDD